LSGLPKKLKLGRYNIPANLAMIDKDIPKAQGILIFLHLGDRIGVFMHGRWNLDAFMKIIRAMRDEIECLSMDDEIASRFRHPYYKMGFN